MRNASGGRYDIEAIPEAVNKVDVSMPGLAKHDFGPGGSPTGGVCCEILWPHVGLRLDDAPHAHRATIIVHEMHADEVTCYGKRAWGVEVAGEFAGSIHEPASYQGACLRGKRLLRPPPGVTVCSVRLLRREGPTSMSRRWLMQSERRS